MKTCRKCGKELVVGENWLEGNQRTNNYICRPCASASRAKCRADNPEREAQRAKEWRDANPDYLRTWRKAHPEKWKADRQAWARANPEKVRAKDKAWRTANPDKVIANGARRRARQRTALCPARNDAEIARVYALAQLLTLTFGTPYHVDHLIPLAKGGKHHEANLVVMRADLNLAKGDRVFPAIVEFFASTNA
ncbi:MULTISPECIES: hypothetical protein [Brevundimonas]|jgi:hypothetical protein|uniref:HNH endonuclease n=1 Tax=Brevundimonas vesicularis TaxID=41276 RepID=A0ABU4KM38_BREVE|nr:MULTISPECIES: hypothetical protein [Brevundimonas]MDX2334090.1 HNH endonuclease [Brevundimonas vesicularis]